jgi:hypothetical protein
MGHAKSTLSGIDTKMNNRGHRDSVTTVGNQGISHAIVRRETIFLVGDDKDVMVLVEAHMAGVIAEVVTVVEHTATLAATTVDHEEAFVEDNAEAAAPVVRTEEVS